MSDDTILEEEAVVETKKKSKKSTSISKTIGTNIMGTITELNTISNEGALYEYLERVSDGVPKEVLARFYESLNNKRSFEDKYMYVYNIALASEGFVAYGNRYRR